MASQQSEATYYQQGNITITNTRAIFGNTSYALANITSVAAGTISPNRAMPIIMLLAGILLVLLGFGNTDGTTCWGMGGLLIAAGLLIMFVSKDTYVVKVGTAGAEQRAYVSSDRAEIEKIVAALNDAIVKRG